MDFILAVGSILSIPLIAVGVPIVNTVIGVLIAAVITAPIWLVDVLDEKLRENEKITKFLNTAIGQFLFIIIGASLLTSFLLLIIFS